PVLPQVGPSVSNLPYTLSSTTPENEIRKTICPASPKAAFSPSDTSFCGEGQNCIYFTDQSLNNPTSWRWIFKGGHPDSSSAQNPSNICYDMPGTYQVTLIASNSAGSDSLTITLTKQSTLVSSASAGTILCRDGSTNVTVSAAGGASPYSGTGTFSK